MLVKKLELGSVLKLILTLVIALKSLCSEQLKCMADNDVLYTFTEPSVDSSQLRNLVYNERDGVLYVGAVNVIYRLNMELRLNGSVNTGPQYDITDCRDTSYQLASCSRASSVSPCVNQALAVDISSNTLIACGTLYHGSCTVFDLRTLTSNQSSFRPVVPSDASKSVVIVIGPGPTSKQTNALFVAAAYSRTANVSAAFNNYGFLAVRKLPSFELAHVDQSSSSLIDIQPKYQDNFPVTFRRALYLSNYVYYFVVRPKSYVSSEMTSHVLRVCASDQKLHSLVELQLECKVGGIVYPYLRDVATWKLNGSVVIDSGRIKLEGDVLFGAFTTSQADAGDSAICAYRLSEIENTFQEAIQKCFNGQGLKGPDYIVPIQSCTRTEQAIDRTYCGSLDYNYPVYSNVTFKAAFGTVVSQTIVTSLQVRNANSKIFALMGTSQGLLLKATIAANHSSGTHAEVYSRVDLRLNRPMPVKNLIAVNDNSVFVLTEKAVVKVRVYNCSTFGSCETCVADPHCAWCLQGTRCTEVAVCPTVGITSRCPRIVQLQPARISETDFKNTSIRATVDFIPPAFSHFDCILKDTAGLYKQTKVATVGDADAGNKLVTCGPFAVIPTFLPSSIYLNLSLELSLKGLPWAAVPISAYSCGSIKLCVPCTQSNSLCKWCAVTQRCLPSAKACGSLPIYSINASSLCPSIDLSPEKNSLPSGKAVNLTLTGNNLMKLHHTNLLCRFTTAKGPLTFTAMFDMPVLQEVVAQVPVTCLNVMLTYDDKISNISVPLAIVSKDHVLDSTKSMQVEVFKCRHLVSSCGRCVTMDPKYQCSWCMDHCSLQEDCVAGTWLSSNDTCPDPRISSFTPSGGPLKGGTKLQVIGENLGKTVSQLDVNLAGKKCSVISEDFIPTVSFVCVTSEVSAATDSVIDVKVNNLFSVSSASKYVHMDPSVSSWAPIKGPCSGGTLVNVTGNNLHFGSTVSVTINDLPAQVLRRTASSLEFVTPRQSNCPFSPSIVMKFDNGDDVFRSPDTFYYVDDPVVTLIDPLTAIASGGNKIDVRGKSLNSVQKPQFVIYVNNTNFTAPCNATTSSTFMICQTPSLSEYASTSRIQLPVTVEFGFLMDDVQQLRKMSSINSKSFSYIEDPKIIPFGKTNVYKDGMKLTISGEDLEPYRQFKDIEVLIGGVGCVYAVVTPDNRITCDPPATDSRMVIKDGAAQVTLKLGNYIKEIGLLSYYDRGPSYGLIFGLIFGLSIPIIIICVALYILCIWRKKRDERKSPQRVVSIMARNRSDNIPNSYTTAETIPLQTRINTGSADVQEEEVAKDDAHYFQELLRKMENPRIRNAAKEVYIARDRLEIGNLLGKGHFGCVYAATLRDTAMKNPISVAVKTIEDSNLDQKMVENFVQEGIIMKNFNHPHVLSLLGLCLGFRKEPMVILPFMANGDLRTFVKDKSRMFTARQLLQLAQQVAEGMSYLSSLNFIHRDLAARNCMIDDKNQVKVADFGLSRELFERQYYSSKDQKAKLPVKWMALESLENFIFTAKSDVWSFGVLMWELMTRGVTPYPDVEVTEMRSYLAGGRRLRKPKYCPENVYAIMTDCWHNVPETRPTFPDLVNRLELLLNPPKRNRSTVKEAEEEPTYINVTDPEVHDYLHPVGGDSNTAANA